MQAIVLAAGKGTRMKSDLPKVLHKLGDKTLLDHVLHHLEKLDVSSPIVVVGYQKDLVMGSARQSLKSVRFAIQEKQLGTGNAVKAAVKDLDINEPTYIINGDNPLFSPQTFLELARIHQDKKAVFSLVTAVLDEPAGYGRILRDTDGRITGIIEKKDATPEQLQIKEVNAGCYCANSRWLESALNKLSPSPVTGEYYLTDLISMAVSEGLVVSGYQLADSTEAMGVNSPQELVEAEKVWQKNYGVAI